MDDCARAAELVEECVRRIAGWQSRPVPAPERDVDGQGPGHAMWMLGELRARRVGGHKAHRWLGYAQGVLVSCGLCDLAEMKECNRQASEEEILSGDATGSA